MNWLTTKQIMIICSWGIVSGFAPFWSFDVVVEPSLFGGHVNINHFWFLIVEHVQKTIYHCFVMNCICTMWGLLRNLWIPLLGGNWVSCFTTIVDMFKVIMLCNSKAFQKQSLKIVSFCECCNCYKSWRAYRSAVQVSRKKFLPRILKAYKELQAEKHVNFAMLELV